MSAKIRTIRVHGSTAPHVSVSKLLLLRFKHGLFLACPFAYGTIVLAVGLPTYPGRAGTGSVLAATAFYLNLEFIS